MSTPFDEDLPGGDLPGFAADTSDPELDLEALETEITASIEAGLGDPLADPLDAALADAESSGPSRLDADLESARIRLDAPVDADAASLLDLALARLTSLEAALSRRAPDEAAPEAHNILRPVLVEIAGDLRSGRLTALGAATRLETAAEADLRALDLDDIEVDVDLGQPESGLGILAGALTGAVSGGRNDRSDATSEGAAAIGDPIDAALLAAVAERDAVAALRIAGAPDTEERRAAYQARLDTLADAIARARA